MAKEDIGIIIATKDRPESLIRLLNSIRRQGIAPVETLVVDAGARSVEEGIADFRDINIRYLRAAKASLTAQRNEGVKALNKEAALVAFLDDDVVLEPSALINMVKFWRDASPETGGASFNDINDSYRKPTLIQKIFMVNTGSPGKVMVSGYQSKICSTNRTIRVDWLSGCAMVYKREVFHDAAFDERFGGYGYCEDLDFSYTVGKRYKMFVVFDAQVRHLSNPESTETSFSVGRMQVANRIYFAKKHPELSTPLCYWACFGLFINNLWKALIRRDRRYLLRSKGNVAGFLPNAANSSTPDGGEPQGNIYPMW